MSLAKPFLLSTTVLFAVFAAPSAAQIAFDFDAEPIRLSDVLGRSVASRVGEPLGTIKDFLVNSTSREIEYLVLERLRGGTVTYAVQALSSGEGTELLLLDEASAFAAEAFSAGGATALTAASPRLSAVRDFGALEALVIELPKGTLARARQ